MGEEIIMPSEAQAKEAVAEAGAGGAQVAPMEGDAGQTHSRHEPNLPDKEISGSVSEGQRVGEQASTSGSSTVQESQPAEVPKVETEKQQVPLDERPKSKIAIIMLALAVSLMN